MAAAVKELNGSENIRVQVSGLLTTLAMFRVDGSTSLRSAVPALISLTQDTNARVRHNAAATLGNLKPTVPQESKSALLTLFRSSDQEDKRSAVWGLARLSLTDGDAQNALSGQLISSTDVRVQTQIIRAVGESGLKAPQIVTNLTALLSNSDDPIVLEIFKTLNDLGPATVNLMRDQVAATMARSHDKSVVALGSSLLAKH
jgi:HEAT repeat protein